MLLVQQAVLLVNTQTNVGVQIQTQICGRQRLIAVDRRLLSVVEDKDLQEVQQIASTDATYELSSRKTMCKQI